MASLKDGYLPGFIEVITGPMRSGKTGEALNLVDRLIHDFGIEVLGIKPACDTRNEGIQADLVRR